MSVWWEYIVATDMTRVEKLGREGWELVSVAETTLGTRFYLKRAVPS